MKLLLFIIFTIFTRQITFGQNIRGDTIMSMAIVSEEINRNEKDFLTALNGATKYITSLLGNSFYSKYIRSSYRQYEKDAFDVYVKRGDDEHLLESHTYYHFRYYVANGKDTVSYFELLMDSIGRRSQFDKEFHYSSPERFILGLKKLFPNQLKISFIKAKAIAKRHGYHTSPYFKYDIYTRRFYWLVSEEQVDGSYDWLEINADTGKTEDFDGAKPEA